MVACLESQGPETVTDDPWNKLAHPRVKLQVPGLVRSSVSSGKGGESDEGRREMSVSDTRMSTRMNMCTYVHTHHTHIHMKNRFSSKKGISPSGCCQGGRVTVLSKQQTPGTSTATEPCECSLENPKSFQKQKAN